MCLLSALYFLNLDVWTVSGGIGILTNLETDGTFHKAEENLLELESILCETLSLGIKEPIIRVDAVGAIFLSSSNPGG